MNKKSLLITLIVALSALLAVLVLWNPQPHGDPSLSDAANLAPPPQGGEFSINTLDGRISLSDMRGKVVVLYFGYMLCPDICPTSLGFTAVALNQLSDTERAQVQTVFVSVDPDRDSLERLKDYASYFHPSMIGGTDTQENIDAMVAQYGASYRKVDTDTSLGYLVDHSATLYVIDREGKLFKNLPHGIEPSKIRAALQEALGETQG